MKRKIVGGDLASIPKKKKTNTADWLLLFTSYKDIGLFICVSLAIRDQLQLAQTNKTIYGVVQELHSKNSFWKNQIHTMFPYLRLENPDKESIKTFKKEFLELKQIKIEDLSIYNPIDENSKKNLQKDFQDLMMLVYKGDFPKLKEFCETRSQEKLFMILALNSVNDLNPIKYAATKGYTEIFIYLYSILISHPSEKIYFWNKTSRLISAISIYEDCLNNKIPQQSFAACIVRGKNPQTLNWVAKSLTISIGGQSHFIFQVAYWDGFYNYNLINTAKYPATKEEYIEIDKKRILGASHSGAIEEMIKKEEARVKELIRLDDYQLNRLIFINCSRNKKPEVLKNLIAWGIEISPFESGFKECIKQLIIDSMDDVLLYMIDKNLIKIDAILYQKLICSIPPGSKKVTHTFSFPILNFVLFNRENDSNKTELVEQLIDRGADLNNKIFAETINRPFANNRFILPLYMAALVNDMDSFQLLIEKGAQYSISIKGIPLTKLLAHQIKYDRKFIPMLDEKLPKELDEKLPKELDEKLPKEKELHDREFISLLDEKLRQEKDLIGRKYHPRLHKLFDVWQSATKEKFDMELKENLKDLTVYEVEELYSFIFEKDPTNDKQLSEIEILMEFKIDYDNMLKEENASIESEEESISSESEEENAMEEDNNTFVRKNSV